MRTNPRQRDSHARQKPSETTAGGQDHYAAYLANTDGFEVELVARET